MVWMIKSIRTMRRPLLSDLVSGREQRDGARKSAVFNQSHRQPKWHQDDLSPRRFQHYYEDLLS